MQILRLNNFDIGWKKVRRCMKENLENFFEQSTGNSANPKFNNSSMVLKKLLIF